MLPYSSSSRGFRASTRPGAIHRHKGVLRGPALALAATDEREHQRGAAPVLPQGHRPLSLVGRRPRGRRSGHQQPSPRGSRLEDPQRGLRRTATLALTARCCINRMNSPNTSRWPTRTRSSPPGSKRQSAPSATAKTTPSQRPLMASTRPNSSIATAPGRPSPRSRSRLWTGSTGGTRSASTKRSPIAPRPKSKRPTLAPRRPRPRPSNHGTKPRALHGRPGGPMSRDIGISLWADV